MAQTSALERAFITQDLMLPRMATDWVQQRASELSRNISTLALNSCDPASSCSDFDVLFDVDTLRSTVSERLGVALIHSSEVSARCEYLFYPYLHSDRANKIGRNRYRAITHHCEKDEQQHEYAEYLNYAGPSWSTRYAVRDLHWSRPLEATTQAS